MPAGNSSLKFHNIYVSDYNILPDKISNRKNSLWPQKLIRELLAETAKQLNTATLEPKWTPTPISDRT